MHEVKKHLLVPAKKGTVAGRVAGCFGIIFPSTNKVHLPVVCSESPTLAGVALTRSAMDLERKHAIWATKVNDGSRDRIIGGLLLERHIRGCWHMTG